MAINFNHVTNDISATSGSVTISGSSVGGYSGAQETILSFVNDPVVFESAGTYHTSVTMLDNTKALVTYQDGGNSTYGTACVLSVSGTTVTAGTPVVFESGYTQYTSVTMLDNTKALVTYQDSGNSNYGTACVLSVSGTTVTAGTPVVFESANTDYINVTALDSAKALVTYTDGGNGSYGTACVLSVSGTAVTAGTPVVFESATTYYTSVTALDSTKALVTYRDGGNSNYGTACVLSVSGTTVTVGTPVVFESASTHYTSVTMLDSTKALVTYRDEGNSSYGTACVLSVSGTTVTAGTPVVFESASTTYTSVTRLENTKALVTYADIGNSYYGTACVLSVSGTAVTVGTPVVFESAYTDYISVTMLDSTKALVTYRDVGNSSYGTAQVLLDTLALSPTSPQTQILRSRTANFPVKLPNTSSMSEGSFPFVIQATGLSLSLRDYNNTEVMKIPPRYLALCSLTDATTGTWRVFTVDTSGNMILGTPSVFESASTYYTSVTMLDSTKALVTYRVDGTSSYGTACVLSVSGTTVTAGSPVVFESAITAYISVTALDSTKALVTYRDAGNSSYGTACVLSVSGTTVTAGTPVVFASASTDYISVTMLGSTKALVTYRDGGNGSYGTACVLSVSGTTVTAGTPVVFESAYTDYISVTMLDSTKALVTYRDVGNSSYGTACVLSAPGTTVTAGTPVVFESASTYYTSVTALDSTKALVTYRDDGNSSYGTACVLSVSGTTVTAGSPVVFESASIVYTSVTMLDSTKALVTYQDIGNGNYGTACVLSVSGTTVTASTPVVFESASTDYISVTARDSTKALVTYQDGGNSSYGTACCIANI